LPVAWKISRKISKAASSPTPKAAGPVNTTASTPLMKRVSTAVWPATDSRLEHPPRVRTGQARCIGLPSLRTEAVLLQSNAPPHHVGASARVRIRQARCIGLPSLRTEAVLLQSNAPPHSVGAPAPGANGAGSVYWFAFASHRGGAPTIERATPPRRSTRPGCEWYGLGVLVCLRFAPRRCSYNRTRHPTCRSTRPGCEWYGLGVLVRLRFAPRRCSYNRTHHPTP